MNKIFGIMLVLIGIATYFLFPVDTFFHVVFGGFMSGVFFGTGYALLTIR